jgi:hypothetical protein
VGREVGVDRGPLVLADEGGRGLALVDLLSDAWGIEPEEPGKSVWFRLRLARAGAPMGRP